MKEKIKLMLEIYNKKHEEANQWNQHADALRHEGSVMVLETLLIYIKEEEAEVILEEARKEEVKSEGHYPFS